jgi:uncharacterized protein YceK
MSIRIMSKLQNLLFVLLLFAMTGCGASNSKIAGTDGNPSSKITAKFNWAADGKSTAKTVAAVPAGVVSVRLRITGPYQIAGDTSTASRYTAAKATFPAAAGSGSIAVFPGTGLIVIAEALDAGDTVLYEGIVSSLNGAPIAVAAGATTDLGTITIKAPPVKEADKPCLACHENSRDANGNSLVSNYKTSRHYNITASPAAKYGVNSVGCAGCHGPQHNDLVPSASGRCAECHTQATGFGPDLGTGSVSANHYAKPSRYLDATNGNCSTCHQPHLLSVASDERAAWAESGHGETAAAPWVPSASHAWRVTGSTANFQTGVPASDCLRCHTADGFAQFVSSGYTNVNNLPGDSTINSPLNCNACHTDNTFSMRPSTAFTAKYNAGNSSKTFPDVGTSNLCIACHSARENGDAIFTSSSDFSNKSFTNSHYMGSAAIMYMSNAFINFTSLTAPTPSNTEGKAFASKTTYAKTLLPDSASTPFGISGGVSSVHRLIGTPGIVIEGEPGNGTDYLAAGNIIASNGPCVNCHVQASNPNKGAAAASGNPLGIDLYAGNVPAKRDGTGHSLAALDEGTIKQICLPCHAHTKGLNLQNFIAVKVEPARTPFQDALELIKKILLNNYNIKYDGAAYPYFYDMQKDATGKTSLTDWTRKGVAGLPVDGLSQIQAKRLMGACFNLNLLARDPGAYAHGRTFSQRLQYDTIDYLDDLQMNFSALNTARTVYPAKFFGNNANTGYNVDLATYPVASEGILWLSGTHPNNNEILPPDTTTVIRVKLRP